MARLSVRAILSSRPLSDSIRMKKALIGLVAIVVIGLLAYTLLFDRNAAPQVSYTSLTGQQASTDSLKGKVVLVNFWATSCSGCVEEMPEIKKLHQQYGGRGLAVMAVAMSYDEPNYVIAYSRTHALPFFVCLSYPHCAPSKRPESRLNGLPADELRARSAKHHYLGRPRTLHLLFAASSMF